MTSWLRRADPPWLLTYDGAESAAYELSWRISQDELVSRVVRGHKMRSEAELFDEVAAAFQFPDYFGENWSAFAECLSDLSWMPGAAYVMVITNAHDVLVSEPPAQLQSFARIGRTVATQWAQPINAGKPWDRPAVPFHIVIQGLSTDLSHRSLWGGPDEGLTPMPATD
jgi:hypothetical protein